MLKYTKSRLQWDTKSVADLHSKISNATPLGPVFFIFMQFSAKFGQIIGWRSPSPHLGSPRSAAEDQKKTARYTRSNRTPYKRDPGQNRTTKITTHLSLICTNKLSLKLLVSFSFSPSRRKYFIFDGGARATLNGYFSQQLIQK